MTRVRRRYPPVARSKGTPNEKLAAQEIEEHRPRGRTLVLSRLREGDWVPGEELVELAGSEALRRVRELRSAGHIIEARPAGGGPWEYHYEGRKMPGQCVPCSVGKHVDCVVDNNTSLMREPCSCAKHHGERVRKIKRRKRRR